MPVYISWSCFVSRLRRRAIQVQFLSPCLTVIAFRFLDRFAFLWIEATVSRGIGSDSSLQLHDRYFRAELGLGLKLSLVISLNLVEFLCSMKCIALALLGVL